MKNNKLIDMMFYGIVIVSAIFIFDQAFADPVSSSMGNSQASSSTSRFLFLYGNQTEPPSPEATITVFTDKSSYVVKEFIAISGSVSPIADLKFVELEIFNPDGELIHAEQPMLQGGGLYHASFITGSYKWNKIGIYTVKVFYGNSQAKTNFYFSKTESSEELTMNDVKLMRSAGITQLYNEINALTPGQDFSTKYANMKNKLLNDTKAVNQAVLDNEYYATFVGLSQIKENVNVYLESPAKEKISTLIDRLIVSLKIETTPEFPFFAPILIGFVFLLFLSVKNRLFFR